VAPRILSVVGNRPQFVKAAPLHLALRERATLRVVDTGQHYDRELAGVFYEELALDPPDHHLGVGSGSHGAMTARILERIEPVIAFEAPDWLVVFGDTNSTLAAALAAAKLGVPVAHVEAGLRSFDRAMPEEVNRVLVDTLSAALLCPSEVAVANLAAEGITAGVEVVGDVMADAARIFGPLAERMEPSPLATLGLSPGSYLLATVHRDANTRQPALGRLVAGLSALGEPVVLPLHPRTRAALKRDGLAFGSNVRLVEPASYLAFTALLRGARALVTDSGGAQKEAYYHGVPCITLRRETEWVETVTSGWNVLVGDDAAALASAVAALSPPVARPALYGDGHAAERIAAILARAVGRGQAPSDRA
jgi:UDP-N-acetylglucosamine 2-epimerase